MVQNDGFEVKRCQVKINQDMDSDRFGEVTGVRVEVCSLEPGQSTGSAWTGGGQDGVSSGTGENLRGNREDSTTGNMQIQVPRIAVENTEEVEVTGDREIQNENLNTIQGQSQNTIQGETGAEKDTVRVVSGPVYQKIGELRSRISSYCGVEERNVEIGILEEKR